jgi:hypothetical protein
MPDNSTPDNSTPDSATSASIPDDYLDNFDFGRASNKDVLLLVVATLTPPHWDDAPPTDEAGAPIFASETGGLSEAGKAFVATRMERLAWSLTRPFNDDDCSYGGEYAEGDMNPLRFVSGSSQSGFLEVTTFRWMPYGGESEEELQEGSGYYNPRTEKFTVAFLIALARCSDASAYLLYWDHIAPYLAIPDCEVEILAYNDDRDCVTVQGYSEGEIDEEHDSIWAQKLLRSFELSANELRALTLSS